MQRTLIFCSLWCYCIIASCQSLINARQRFESLFVCSVKFIANKNELGNFYSYIGHISKSYNSSPHFD